MNLSFNNWMTHDNVAILSFAGLLHNGSLLLSNLTYHGIFSITRKL